VAEHGFNLSSQSWVIMNTTDNLIKLMKLERLQKLLKAKEEDAAEVLNKLKN